MHLHRALLLLIVLATLAAHGCGAKPAANSPATPSSAAVDDSGAATSPAADSTSKTPQQSTSSQPVSLAPKPHEKPSPEQIAKWAIPEFQPLQLSACSDGFGDPAVLGMAISPDAK